MRRVEEDVEKEEGRQNVDPAMKSNRGTFSASGTDINVSTFVSYSKASYMALLKKIIFLLFII